MCSVASEEIQFDDWQIDVVVGASQKGLGVPPGLSVVMASPAALDVLANRKSRLGAYYASWNKWLPIMEAYENGPAKYFATPPVQLIGAFHVSLLSILKESPSLEERFAKHKEVSKKVKDTVESWGLGLVPLSREASANGMCVPVVPLFPLLHLPD